MTIFGLTYNTLYIRQMEKKDYTPTKNSKLINSTSAYGAIGRQSSKFSGQMSLVKQYEALKLQAKQLEIVNRQLVSQAEKLQYQKNMNESKLLQKATFQEESMIQFQKEKNYQIDMMKTKNEEVINGLKRQYQNRIEDLQKQIKSRELFGFQLNDKSGALESRIQQLRGVLEQMELEMVKHRENNSSLTEQVTKEEFANKKLEMLAEQLERQRNQMEDEIHILLDIQAEKSRTLSTLELQYQQSEESIANLNQKLGMLTQNFGALEEHIAIMKDRLLNAEGRGEEVDKQLQLTECQISQRQQLHSQQKDRELRLRDEIEAHRQRQTQKIAEIRQLIGENERIYSDSNAIRFKLYDVSIQQGIDV